MTLVKHAGSQPLDAIVVGAGFAGLYALHKLRSRGLSVRVLEAAPELGGTWYHNRYPGARCDVESVDYCYSFSEELQQEWNWTEKYATQAEILRYLNWVADKLDLRRDIAFDTRVASAVFDETTLRWTLTTDGGQQLSARFCLMATGPLSAALTPNFAGLDTFAGEIYHTAHGHTSPSTSPANGSPSSAPDPPASNRFRSSPRAPRTSTSSSARPTTASRPAISPLSTAELDDIKANYPQRRHLSWCSGGGSPHLTAPGPTMEFTAAQRRAAFETRWQLGGVLFSKTFPDQLTDPAANEEARKFYEEKVRAVIDDPAVAEMLIPNDHPIGAKRICTDSNYFQTFNQPNVSLVSVRATPIESVDATGIHTTEDHYDLDMIVLATGFDAMTGALAKIDIVGRDGVKLRDDWAHGPRTYLGLGVDGFPNMFLISGPGAPAVLANMVLHAEAQVNWIAAAIGYLHDHDCAAIEATTDGVDNWVDECARRAETTLFPKANSWYMGANVPGKPRGFMLFVGGFATYNDICAQVADAGYKGFDLIKRPR